MHNNSKLYVPKLIALLHYLTSVQDYRNSGQGLKITLKRLKYRY